MKEESRRARRIHRRNNVRKQSPLNLVSLMDIFTILVFFLLVNSSNTQQLPSSKDLVLPTSVAKKVPEETLVIAVTESDILVQGRKVADVATVIREGKEDIPGLKKELDFLSGGNSGGSNVRRKVTIMGHENISYDLVRKILNTCQRSSYTNIAFAATQVANKTY